MDDLIKRYYEAEMRYLREAGKEFAQVHPDRAGMLNLDRVGDRDPYVERLFEGFAFLMGRLRQKLDDDLPELTEGVVSLLWPHYLRIIPSLSIVELFPDHNVLARKEVVEAGFGVQTGPVGPSQTRCKYQTTQTVELQPLKVSKAGVRSHQDGRSVIYIRFDFGPMADWKQMDISNLRLYLNADTPVASALYRSMVHQVASMNIRFPGYQDGATQPFNGKITPAGFADDERLWLKPDNAFGGYQLLLEYFTFREKFMFLDLAGLDLNRMPEGSSAFELELILNEVWADDLPFSAENIRLHCSPVINLFPLEADPVRVNQLDSEYLLRPLLQQDGHIEIYSVDAVQSISRQGRAVYVPFTSFRHRGGMLRHDTPERYYHTRVRRGASGLHDTWLILGGQVWERAEEVYDETLSLRITGTNGMLPRKALRNASINQISDSQTGVIAVRNLCAPTLPCYPPVNDRFHWRVLSHLAPNYLSLMNAEVLRGTLALYDWTDNELNRRRLEGIVDVKHKPIRRMAKGMLERGVEIEITLNAHQFPGEGDISLFGELLHQFFALYADLNLFTRLTLVLLPTGKRLTWNDSKTARSPL
ncbi:type VI secretion protein ImpG [Pragia fontium]|uniref:Type VI secretion protein ImpG n=1 Tax=Pragia fontium TaxID=82985 RepID=A0ABQ5LE10_9GAMM|nr:type VI secretion system baseplate subunit TssF [Pragia fontium]AKJ42110.1 type VI secretion protein ImpG [Pragia fontium]GKX61848.1 type VI secretion protein ImpG [Pragia fontium]